jgi:hypothetical protein
VNKAELEAALAEANAKIEALEAEIEALEAEKAGSLSDETIEVLLLLAKDATGGMSGSTLGVRQIEVLREFIASKVAE